MPNDLPTRPKGDAGAKENAKSVYFETTLSILGYREDGEWVALALEMDLRGYGRTWTEALEELDELVLMQISFAHFKGQIDMIWKSAEEQYWELFRQAQRARLAEVAAAEHADDQVEFHAGGLVIPPAHVIAAQSGRFLPANG